MCAEVPGHDRGLADRAHRQDRADRHVHRDPGAAGRGGRRGRALICSLLLQLNKEAMDLRVVRLVPLPDGRFVEHPAPTILPGRRAARARRLRQPALRRRPHARGAAARPARSRRTRCVVLRLRGRTSLGSTFFGVVSGYAAALAESGGRLYLSGVAPRHGRPVRRACQVADHEDAVHVFAATEVLGESTLAAVADARHVAGRAARTRRTASTAP